MEAAPPTEALAEACQHAAALAWQAGQVQQECGLDILPDEFVRSTLRFGLVEARRASLWGPCDAQPVLRRHRQLERGTEENIPMECRWFTSGRRARRLRRSASSPT